MYLLNPPAYGYPDDGERPPFVLIEPKAYFADRKNATTARCKMSGFDGDFKVTFCIARPPLVSYMCFYATKYDHTKFAVAPHILATETDGGLVLLCVVFGNHRSAIEYAHNRQYLVYDARARELKHLPHPGDLAFNDDSVAMVRKCPPHGASHDCSNCSYVLAAQLSGFGYKEPCEICLYDSDTESWWKKLVVLKPLSCPVPDHSTCKTITIGGDKGTVAWVDFWHNIILCDVLVKCPKLRFLPLPPPVLPANAPRCGNPSSVRDIAVLGGFFKYVEMQSHLQPGSSTLHHWKATLWSIKTSSSSPDRWVEDGRLDSSKLPEPLLPNLQVDPEKAQPTLSTLHIGLPKLSLQDDGIVYFLSKIDYRDRDHTAWVLAVDMRKQIIQEVKEFSPTRTVGLALGYSASRISKYLKGTKQNQKRPGIPLLKSPSKNSKKYAGTSMVI